MKTRFMISLFFVFFAKAALAVSPGSLLTYEGVLTDSGGTPITAPQTVTFSVLYGSCVLYSETQNITPGSVGEFSVIVGTGTRTDTTNNTADRIFASAGSVNCQGASAVSMAGFTTRALRINVAGTDLTPDVTVGNIPTSINSQKLADKGASDFLQVNAALGTTQANLESVLARYTTLDSLLSAYTGGTLTAQTATNFTGSLAGDVGGTQGATVVNRIKGVNLDMTGLAAGKILKYNGTAFSVADDLSGSTPGDSSYSVKGLVQFDTDLATSGIQVTSGVARVNTGTSAGQIVKLDATGKLPAVDGSALTNTPKEIPTGATAGQVLSYSGSALQWITPSSTDATKLPLAGGSMSGAIDMGGNNLTNVGFVTMSANKSLHLSNNITDPSLSTADKGKVWFNSTSNQIKFWDGSTTQTLGVAGSGVTSVSGTSPISVTNGSTTPLISVSSASSSTMGVMQAGSGLSAASGIISVSSAPDLSTITGTGLVQRTGPGTYAALGTLAPLNVTGSSIGLNISSGLFLNTGSLQVDTGTTANKVVALDSSARLPAVDGSQLTNVVAGGLSVILPITQGGTGGSTKAVAFNNLSPLTTKGDLVVSSGTANTRLPAGTNGQFLVSDSAEANGLKWVVPNFFVNGGNSFGADANIGLNDSYNLNIKTAGATRININPAGNVGIGVSNSAYPLSVGGTAATGTALNITNFNSNKSFTLNTGGTGSAYGSGAFAINDDIAAKTRFVIDASGAAAFGGPITNIAGANGPGVLTLNGPGATTADSGILEMNNPLATVSAGTTAGKMNFIASNNSGNKTLASIQAFTDGSGGAAGYGGKIMFMTKADNSPTLNINFVMTNTGSVGIGVGLPAYRLDVGGDINTSTNYRIAGTTICTSAGCLSSSDRRLKEDITPLQNSLDNILKLDGVSYTYIDKNRFTEQKQVGVIAQDVEQVFPEVVYTDPKSGLKAVAYDHLVAPLIEAVKSLYAKITATDAKVSSQDRRLASVEDVQSSTQAELEKLKKENEELKKKNEKLEKDLNLIKSHLGL
ncbi:tail fiber domain-containing protein [Bdellovibrio sp. GT3]|uniref:tail fiber domain-containing protein n=1 Tax=Bdellovibrio sp. GT3 TaxID=3136282 RepID=UPI0030F33A0E